MKTYICLCFLLAFILVFTPALAIPTEISVPYEEIKDTISVMRHMDGETVELTIEEYLCGAVAGEMPAVYEKEALKAQAVACYTYALVKEAEGITITDNPQVNQSYLSKEELREKWGDNFDKYYGKIEDAVSEVMGEYLTYDGKLVSVIAYHAISSGTTEAASDIWGGEPIPYLVPVDSSVDKLSPDYKSTTVYSEKQFRDRLVAADIGYSADNAGDCIVTEVVRTPSGSVKTAVIDGVTLSGADLRTALGLRSTNFSITVKNKTFTVDTIGYGHGVGMSQYGADAYAAKGQTYKEILAHYYPGTEISTAKDK